MTCDEVKDRLDDYVDGTLGETELQDLELHLAACAACGEEERRLRSVVAQAAALPAEMSPPRDLWPGIADRIAAARARPAVRTLRRAWWSPAAGLAAAVVLALAATLARVWSPEAREGAAGAGVVTEAAWTTDPSLLAAEREYDRATAQLMAALDTRKAALPPETVAAVERDMTTIDAALRQVRTALQQDPGNPQLSHMLASTHQKKVDALQRVVRLSSQL